MLHGLWRPVATPAHAVYHHPPVAEEFLDPFDGWLWALDDERLATLRLRDVQRTAMADGVLMPQLTVLTVIGDGADPVELLRARARGVHDSRRPGEIGLLRARMRGPDYVVAVWRAGDEVFHLVGSLPVTNPAWDRVEHGWINAAAPHLSPVVLNRDDFEAIGDGLAEHGDISVSRMTARVLRDHSSYSRGWPNLETVRRPTHREALAETPGMLVRTLTLDVGSKARVHLRRTSGASFYQGNFGLFVDVVLHRLQVAAAERRELLSGRERRPRAPIAEILSMDVDRVDLGDPTVRATVLRTITEVRGVQAAVMHDNPYLHVLVTDFLNGASFDVLVTHDGRLDIVPGLRSSVGSLARVTDALGEALGMRELSLQPVDQFIDDDELLAA